MLRGEYQSAEGLTWIWTVNHGGEKDLDPPWYQVAVYMRCGDAALLSAHTTMLEEPDTRQLWCLQDDESTSFYVADDMGSGFEIHVPAVVANELSLAILNTWERLGWR